VSNTVSALVAILLLFPASAVGQEGSGSRETPAHVRVFVGEFDSATPLVGTAVRLVPRVGRAVARTTDRSGHATFAGLAPGSYGIVIERLGYGVARDSLDLRAGSRTLVTVELAAEALALEPIVVSTTRRAADMGGFEQRRHTGLGHFITRSELEERHPIHVSDLLSPLAGVRVTPAPTRFGSEVRMRGGCLPDLVIDGVLMRPFAGLGIDDYVAPGDVEAVEVYRGPQAPLQLSNSPCGAVVVWTRIGEPTRGGGATWKRALAAGGLAALFFVILR